ncbi:MAG: ATP-binding region ATPase domain protein [Gemmatimonadetes bacterium]|nr:ATP-binding region ATPase domain protein [Gemmatimonadota bacterium]
MPASPRGAAREALLWTLAAALLTAAMLHVRDRIGEAHVALGYLLVVLGASARGGRRVGMGLAVLAFLAFNYLFLRPYYTLEVRNPLDWLVLLAFLAAGAVAAQLLHRAQREAAHARRRADEIDQLATLGAEALKAARAEDAVVTIAGVIRTALAVDRCDIYLRDDATARLRLMARSTSADGAVDDRSGTSTDTAGAGDGSSAIGSVDGLRRDWRARGRRWNPRTDAVAGVRSTGSADGASRRATAAWDEARIGEISAEMVDGVSAPLIDHSAVETVDTADNRQTAISVDGFSADDVSIPETALSSAEFLRGTDSRSWLMALRVKDEPVGVLRLETAGGLMLDARQRRFAEALAYYAALGLERVRLTEAAGHAEALREADRLKDALLASVSHDLRTPLTTIKALAHELAAGGDERAHVVEAEADRLNRFVADLLDLARLNAGALPIRPEPAAAEDVLGAALQQAAAVWPARTVDASVQPGELLVGRFDFVHTLHVITNLIENAVKYSPDDTSVEVAVHSEAGRIVFTVADRGPGLAPHEREHVFRPFHRGDGQQGPGSGIGLALARRLAEAQDGEVRYEPRPGGGSRFTLSLPAIPPDELARLSS